MLIPIHSPQFQAMSQRVLEVMALTSKLNLLPFDDQAGRARLLEQILGGPLPDGLTIFPPFFTDHGLNLKLGEDVFVNQNCTFLDYAGISIGAHTMIGPNVTFITCGHPVNPDDRHSYLTAEPINVGDHVWIGAGAMILPGVTIGADAVVAAGAVVVDDVPASSLVTGQKAAIKTQWGYTAM